MSVCGSVSTAHSEDRHTECKEEAAARRAAERQQEWCRYSLMLASVEDGRNIGNATIRAMCENLRQPSVVIKRRTLDELEQLTLRRHSQLDAESAEQLLSSVLELLFVGDRHIRRRAMCVLAKFAPKVVDVCPLYDRMPFLFFISLSRARSRALSLYTFNFLCVY